MSKKSFNKVTKVLKQKRHKLLILRHGHTALNAGKNNDVDKIRGWQDVPLNQEGREDAEKAGKKLKKATNHINVVYSSDLIRAVETAEIATKDFKAPIVRTMKLRPWHLGIYEGKSSKEVWPNLCKHIENPEEKVPDGESFNSFKRRYLTFVKEKMKEAKEREMVILLVSHFRNVKLVEAWLAKGCPDDLSFDEDVMEANDKSPGEIFEIPC